MANGKKIRYEIKTGEVTDIIKAYDKTEAYDKYFKRNPHHSLGFLCMIREYDAPEDDFEVVPTLSVLKILGIDHRYTSSHIDMEDMFEGSHNDFD